MKTLLASLSITVSAMMLGLCNGLKNMPSNILPSEKLTSNMKKVNDKLISILNAAEDDANRYLLPGQIKMKNIVVNGITQLREDIRSATTLKTQQPSTDWEAILSSAHNETWLTTTESVAETLFFKNIADIFDYGGTGYDPFVDLKFESLRESQSFIEDLSTILPDILTFFSPSDALRNFIYLSAIASQKHVSIFGANPAGAHGAAKKRKLFVDGVLAASRQSLLYDDADVVVDFLSSGQVTDRKGGEGDVCIIASSTGRELVADLALAQVLLMLNFCKTVTFHVKSFPSGLLGATRIDILGHIEHLADPRKSDVWAVRHFGENLRNHLMSGRLVVRPDNYWCLPTPFWDMPPSIESVVKESKLTIVKGEENYRRLLGDRLWPKDKPTKEVFGYWPSPVCAIRMVKSEVCCGLGASASRKLETEAGPSWAEKGTYGVIQFVGDIDSSGSEGRPL